MKRFGVIGAGRFGTALAEHLARYGAEVILLDRDADAVHRMSDTVARAAQGEATDRDVLTEVGLHQCDAVAVAIGDNMEGSILTTLNLKDIGVPYVVAKAVTDLHGKVLERIGADLVVYPDKERAIRLARSLMMGSSLDFFEVSDGVSVVELPAPERYAGKTLAECEIRRALGATVLAIKNPKTKKRIVGPDADDRIEAGDTLVLFGPDRKLASLH